MIIRHRNKLILFDPGSSISKTLKFDHLRFFKWKISRFIVQNKSGFCWLIWCSIKGFKGFFFLGKNDSERTSHPSRRDIHNMLSLIYWKKNLIDINRTSQELVSVSTINDGVLNSVWENLYKIMKWNRTSLIL